MWFFMTDILRQASIGTISLHCHPDKQRLGAALGASPLSRHVTRRFPL
jgi:hypothetical protein